MRVGITEMHHFVSDRDGGVFSDTGCDYAFYQRLLGVFDEVRVFARVQPATEAEPEKLPARSNGPGVTFHPIPEFRGPRQYLQNYGAVGDRVFDFLRSADAFVLRVPSYMATRVWRKLRAEGRPYAVEAVGDPWVAFAPGSYPSPLRPFLRAKWTWDQKRQCRHAHAASYVTERALQRRYPADGWQTHYSSIELPASAIVDDTRIDERIREIHETSQSGGPWRLTLVGSLLHLVKAPDVLIDAVADAVERGTDLELTIVGSGHFGPVLEARAEGAGIGDRVRFVGHVPAGDAVRAQLDRAHVLVQPSRSEGLPRVVIEAMGRGLPCLASRVGGIPELLDDAFLVSPGDVKGLSQAITNLINDPKRMESAVRRNIRKAAEYRADVLQERRYQLYRRLEEATRQWLERSGRRRA